MRDFKLLQRLSVWGQLSVRLMYGLRLRNKLKALVLRLSRLKLRSQVMVLVVVSNWYYSSIPVGPLSNRNRGHSGGQVQAQSVPSLPWTLPTTFTVTMASEPWLST